MSSNSPNQQNFCHECLKKYPDNIKYQTHLKIKHNNKDKQKEKQRERDREREKDKERNNKISAKIGSNGNNNVNLNEQQLGDLQDRIYTYLGELVEIYYENVRTIQTESLLDQHRSTGQANYLLNFIAKTPYQNQINIITQIPNNYQFLPSHPQVMTLTAAQTSQIGQKITAQLITLSTKLAQQRRYWQFADPFDASIDFEDEFSILDVPKMIRNYPKRNLDLDMGHITIFLVWVGRFCKPNMWKLIYQLLLGVGISYEDFLAGRGLREGHQFESREGDWSRYDLKNWCAFIEKHRTMEGRKGGFSMNKKKTKILKQQVMQEGQQQNSNQQKDQELRGFKIKMNGIKIQIPKLEKLLQFYELWVKTILPSLAAHKRFKQQEAQNYKQNQKQNQKQIVIEMQIQRQKQQQIDINQN